MRKEMIELLAKANAEVQKTIEYLKENEYVWGKTRNLKLYDVSHYMWKDMEKDFPYLYAEESESAMSEHGLFYWFCDREYDCYKEWAEGHNIDLNKIMKYVGRTSSFYLTDLHSNYYYGMDCLLYDFINNVASDYYINIDKKTLELSIDEFRVEDDEEDWTHDEAMEDLKLIAEDLYNYVVEELKDAKIVADFIDNYMDNQVEVFKEYCKYEEEKLIEEKEQEEAEEKKANDNCLEIKEKYGISNEDMQILKNNIFSYKSIDN